MLPEALANAIRENCGEALLLDARRGAGIVSDAAQLYETCQRLRNLGFSRCIDLTAVHLPPVGTRLAASAVLDETTAAAAALKRGDQGRGSGDAADTINGVPRDPSFQLYLLLRHPEHAHASLQLKWKYTQTDESFHPSLSRIWPSAGLAERELWELLGIAFSGNDNLFPLLLDPQFDGWPLRRDYALPQRESYGERLLRERYEAGLLNAVGAQLAAVGQASAPAIPDGSQAGTPAPPDAVNRVPTTDSGGGA